MKEVAMRPRPLFASAFVLAAALFLLPACSVNVKKDNAGRDKNVDIQTPFGGIHVNENADVRDTGLPVYPGARPKEKSDSPGEEKSANVDISTSAFGLKVVAVEYESEDPPDKLVAYYQDQLKKYGKVLQCHTSGHGNYTSQSHKSGSDELKCEGDNNGKTIELKVGTESNQHIVAIEPKDKMSDFALVYVRTRGKEGTI
jgi:hypothetical protein